MVHQRTKDLIFNITYFITKLFRPYYLIKFRNSSNLWLHLGSGSNIIDGFINIDGNPFRKRAIYYDIRNQLPFKKSSVQYIFISNVLEHFFPDELYLILNNIYEIMAKDGTLRIVVPDLEKAIDAYVRNDKSHFGDFPSSYQSIGGRFSNHIFCDAQHRITFDFSFLQELLVKAGFQIGNIYKKQFGESNITRVIYEKIKPFEEHFAKTDLFVEAIK